MAPTLCTMFSIAASFGIMIFYIYLYFKNSCELILSTNNTMQFNIVQYNIFGRPYIVSKDAQNERMWRIPESISSFSELSSFGSIDVIAFAEADIHLGRNDMLQEFQNYGFNYSTSILSDPDPLTSLINGGVIIVSKWPIVREMQYIYRRACHYSDCLAAKGVKYARVNKTEGNVSKIFNIFATHLQAWSTPEGRSDRIKQATQMQRFMDSLSIPSDEPVLFSGDFNMDNISFPLEVAEIIKILGASVPSVIGNQLYTSDPHTNVLVGRDGAAKSNGCALQYEGSWGNYINETFYPSSLSRKVCGENDTLFFPSKIFEDSSNMCYCPCCPKEWLDYILWAKSYQQPISTPTLESYPLKVNPFVAPWSSSKDKSSMQLVDLSDHYPVIGKFEFQVNNEIHIPDGCSFNQDCRFRNFHCYCTGVGCHYNGSVIDGGELEPMHPVNENCIYEVTAARCLCQASIVNQEIEEESVVNINAFKKA